MNIQKVSDGIWEFREKGMRVPARIFANEKIKNQIEDGVYEQVKNVAMLPGIVKASMVMPDGHYGYGFPIGGVAAFNLDEGIISPGGVGYDINCITGDSKILHEYGYTKPIAEFENDFDRQRIKCMNFGVKVEDSKINFFMKKPVSKVFRVTTLTNRQVTASAEHPIYTRDGMVEISKLKDQDVAIFPFEGVEYVEPSNEVILDSNGFEKTIAKELKERDLLPFCYNSNALPYVLKIMGVVLGDGSMLITSGKGVIWFYGDESDLKKIRADIEKIGFKPSKIYERKRLHRIKTHYKEYEFEYRECSFKTTSKALVLLLKSLGMPLGNKTNQDFFVPKWLTKAPLWQKRLYLAAFFGAELSSPKTVTDHGYNFYEPMLSVNKKRGFEKSGRGFLLQIRDLLKDFGISSYLPKEREEKTNKSRSIRLRLAIYSKPDNLIRLWSCIGFEYNIKKSHLANSAVQYLREKKLVLEERSEAEERARELKKNGFSFAGTSRKLVSEHVNERFVERSFYQSRKEQPRIAYNFPTFEEYLSKRAIGNTGLVWEGIRKNEELRYVGYVYDFSVNNPHHNFVANNIVVSNCGVRLLTTNLTVAEVKPRMKELMDLLFSEVPSGLGSKSQKVRVNDSEIQEVCELGAKWAVEKGYGIKRDLEHIEENGRMEKADFSKVSHKARIRGKPQVGTLGSGNHFLEVQEVKNIFDDSISKKFDLEEGNIVVMIHCGSRGLGYQVADDYIAVMLRASEKYKINLPDKQLACAPLKSKEADDYIGAMYCSVNYAFANRQMIMHWVRKSFEKLFPHAELNLLYDVAHNIAKFEKHAGQELCVHRKGATRAFAAGRSEIPKVYRDVGQPIIIPGSMGTSSYVLVGTEKAMKETWGSTCHGAGRAMSRHAAISRFRSADVKRKLEAQGRVVRAASKEVLAEEASEAYKDVDEVIASVELAGISRKVAQLFPLGVAKG